MKIIAVMSPKGGIGKTTTSDSIAYMLGEEQGKRVLVLDGDPQGDTSKTFGVYLLVFGELQDRIEFLLDSGKDVKRIEERMEEYRRNNKEQTGRSIGSEGNEL